MVQGHESPRLYEVIPHLPVRQWVLSVPKRLRPFLQLDRAACSGPSSWLAGTDAKRWSDFDQSPVFDLAAPEPIPEFEFDQSPPQDWEA